MDAAEYNHDVPGFIFPKHISDAFKEQHANLLVDKKNERHPALRAAYSLANPPSNASVSVGERHRADKGRQYGLAPTGNASFVLVQSSR